MSALLLLRSESARRCRGRTRYLPVMRLGEASLLIRFAGLFTLVTAA